MEAMKIQVRTKSKEHVVVGGGGGGGKLADFVNYFLRYLKAVLKFDLQKLNECFI